VIGVLDKISTVVGCCWSNVGSITTDTGILTYKEKQTSKHDDIVIIIATDLAGNKVEKSITVSIKNLVQGLPHKFYLLHRYYYGHLCHKERE
jgi:azurin